MTEHDLDALASDLLDGLLPAEQAADALRDPAVARRVDEMRAAQTLLRAVPPVDAHRRDRGIATALSATGDAPPGVAPVPAGVGDLAAHRARPRRRLPASWLTAAAVLLVTLAFGGLVATTQRGSDSDDTAAMSAGDEATGDAAEESSSGAEAPAATTTVPPATGGAGDAETSADSDSGTGTDSATAPAPTVPSPDLGDASSVDELAVRASDATTAFSGAGSGEVSEGLARDSQQQAPDSDADARRAFETCAAPDGATPEAGRVIELTASARLDGEPVAVWVVSEGSTRRMIVVDASCAVVGRRTLP